MSNFGKINRERLRKRTLLLAKGRSENSGSPRHATIITDTKILPKDYLSIPVLTPSKV